MIQSIINKLSSLRSLKAKKGKIHRKACVGLVSTMPRSGTWYNKYFFHFYDQLMQGRSSQEIIEEIVVNSFPTDPFNDYGIHIGIDAFLLTHFNCPGFDNYNGKYFQAWKNLNDWGGEKAGFDSGGGLFKSNESMVDPARNPMSRIVYIYRNPLDQAVSFFRHAQGHRYIESYTDALGNEFSFSLASVKDFFMTAGLDSYIKQYFTFYAMKPLFPDNILLLTYEAMMLNPKDHFTNILRHFGHDPYTPANRRYFQEALRLVTRDSMKKIESKMGRSLGGDQKNANGRHIRDSRTGKWQQHFDSKALDEAEQRLSRFDLSLSHFDLVS